MYQEKETKYDGFAKKLFYDFRKTKKKFPYWERLNFRDRDEWRGIAQLIKRERKYPHSYTLKDMVVEKILMK